MLERASTCLESGRRQLFRAPKPCLRSRRVLHAHFWHHGASDLSLPIWWAASSIFDPASGDVDDRAANKTASSASQPHGGALLDFLYPEKTLALLKRLSVHRPDVTEPRRRHVYATGLRKFSTVRAQSLGGAETSVDAAVVAHAKEEAGRFLRGSDAVGQLRKVLQSAAPGKQELAWQLYTAISEDKLAGQNDLRCNLLNYLVQDGDPAVPGRVLQVFGELEPAARRSSSYRAAIVAYTTLRMIGPAINLLEEIEPGQNLDSLHTGTDVVLRRTIFDEQWDLTLRVFRTVLRQTPKLRQKPTRLAIRYGDTLPEIWQEVAQLPELLEHFQSFLRHVREFSRELRSSPQLEQDLSSFVMTFVPHVMERVLTAKKPDEDFIWNYFIKLFDDLHSLNLPTSACYEYAIKRMMELPRYQEYSNQRKIWFELYRRYRQHYTDQTEPNREGSSPRDLVSRPSQNLIRNLIYQHTQRNGEKRVQDHVQDLRTFYPDRPLRPGLLKHIITFYAIRGDEERVCEYMDELQSNYTDDVDLKILTSLLYVYARRADVEGTIKQFRRIHEEFKLDPDSACWNILLLAYVRADDLDGALECFNNCIDYGIVPDEQTFGPLLDFCAQRGDVEAFETLFSKAKQMGVQLDADVRARAGYVQTFMNAGDPEGAKAIALRMLESWQAGTLSGDPLTQTWNRLIQHHALKGDLAGSRQYYKQMVENNIPLDSWTYGSLMRALIEVKQTNAAYKLLKVTMPQNGFQIHALHYAIVITGFLREGQLEQALEAYERMRDRHVPQTESSREATIQALGTADLQKLANRGAKDPKYQLLRVKDALAEMLVSSTKHEIAHDQPKHSRSIDARNYGAVPQSYYGLMISLYTARSAYKISKKLFQKAQEAAPDSEDHIVPLTLVTAMMEAHLKAGNHNEVDRCWAIARLSADKLTKTFHQVVHQPPAIPEVDSLLDPSIQARFQDSRISNNRRHILIRPARLYIRSLLARGDDKALLTAQRTIRNLLVNGFTLDNFVWNEFIQHLALRNRLVDAFTICEEYLMPRFPGWRNLMPGYLRKNLTGYQWMELRHYEIKKTSVLPRYKTLVLLAKMYGQTKRDERNGIGYDTEAQAWLREVLEKSSPNTVRAIETMPRTYDKLQGRYFDSV
jgi:pentatricopeptide repeat-containing protein PET309